MKSPWDIAPATPPASAGTLDLSAFGGRPPSIEEAFDLVSRTPGPSPILRLPDPQTRALTPQELADIASLKASPAVLQHLEERKKQLVSRYRWMGRLEEEGRRLATFLKWAVPIAAGVLVIIAFHDLFMGNGALFDSLIRPLKLN